MKGDFSKWQFDEYDNFAGVLHQQGRVLLDADWNAQTRITNHWQDTAARDTIGPGVAAVPADEHEGFEVTNAEVEGGQVQITISPGRVSGILRTTISLPFSMISLRCLIASSPFSSHTIFTMA